MSIKLEEYMNKFKEDIFEESIQFLHEKDKAHLENTLCYETGTFIQKIKEIILIAIEITKERRLDIIENNLRSKLKCQ